MPTEVAIVLFTLCHPASPASSAIRYGQQQAPPLTAAAPTSRTAKQHPNFTLTRTRWRRFGSVGAPRSLRD